MSEIVTSRRWNPRLARVIDVAFATIAVLLLLPLMLGIALTIRLGGGPVLFAQIRLGRNGVPFHMHKFRTLATVPDGASVAPANDARATAIGRMLRRWHVDELPQLIDVLRGKMALVGPRPEVPSNLEAVAPSDLAGLHAVRPGVTGPTQLAFLAEDELLAECDEPTRIYRQVLVPAKACEDLAWLARRTLIGDLRNLITTPYHLASRRARDRSRIRVRALIAAAASSGSNRT